MALEIGSNFYHLQAEEAFKKGAGILVASAAILYDSKILLLQKPEGHFLGGLYELPGGKLEHENLERTLIREVGEETKLRVRKVDKFLGSFEYINRRSKTKFVQFVYNVSVNEPIEVSLSDEHQSYAWADRYDIGKYKIISSNLANIINSVMWEA